MRIITKNLNRFRGCFSGLSYLYYTSLHWRAGVCTLTSNSTKGHGFLNSKSGIISPAGNRHYSSKHTKKNFYKTLGISPKATQAQIKTAYYDLSLKHHPDRHKGSQKSHNTFQEISEAYSVLGSLDSRKQYDRAMIVEGVLSPEQARPFHTPQKPSASIYDFDEWAKRHYFQALLRKQKDKRERRDEEIERSSHKIPEGSFRLVCLGVFLAIFVAGIYSHRYTEKVRSRQK